MCVSHDTMTIGADCRSVAFSAVVTVMELLLDLVRTLVALPPYEARRSPSGEAELAETIQVLAERAADLVVSEAEV